MLSHLWVQVHVKIFIWNEFWLISTWTKEKKTFKHVFMLVDMGQEYT